VAGVCSKCTKVLTAPRIIPIQVVQELLRHKQNIPEPPVTIGYVLGVSRMLSYPAWVLSHSTSTSTTRSTVHVLLVPNLLIDAVRGTNLSRVLVTDVTSNSFQLQGQFDHVDEGTTMLAFS